MMRAGLPITIAPDGTLCVTTAPAPTMACSPMIRPGKITAPPPDGCAFANSCDREMIRIGLRARELVIGKGNVGADEHVILDTQAIPELNSILDGDPITHDDIVFDKDLGANVAVASNPGIGQHDDELPDSGSCTDLDALHVCTCVNHRVHWLVMCVGFIRPPVSILGVIPSASSRLLVGMGLVMSGINIPDHGFFEPIAYSMSGLIAEQGLRLADVSQRVPYVAGA